MIFSNHRFSSYIIQSSFQACSFSNRGFLCSHPTSSSSLPVFLLLRHPMGSSLTILFFIPRSTFISGLFLSKPTLPLLSPDLLFLFPPCAYFCYQVFYRDFPITPWTRDRGAPPLKLCLGLINTFTLTKSSHCTLAAFPSVSLLGDSML